VGCGTPRRLHSPRCRSPAETAAASIAQSPRARPVSKTHSWQVPVPPPTSKIELQFVCPLGLFIFGPNQPATRENALTPPQQETALKNTLQKYHSRHQGDSHNNISEVLQITELV